uniref:Nucleolus and neural progenitor protein-like N-terminal domain-containing protein n=1 Tax=Oryza rufipogon TaxID=4529 RepID=A0A0E0QTE8_ORYRU
MAERKEGEGKVVVVEEEEEERRLRGALRSLQQEAGVLERLVYKHRNQHRGAAYFQYLLKVRRDVRLLLAAGLGDVLTAVFPVLASRKPANTILAVNRVRRSLVQTIVTMRGFWVSHACYQSDSCFASKSEGSGSTVYNKASDLIDRKQSVKISIGGAQAFREYYPSSNDARTFLECVWVKDKFVLHENTKGNCEKTQAEDQKSCASESAVLYETLGQVSEDMENAEGLNSPMKLPDATLANQPEKTHCHRDEDSQSRRQLVNDNNSNSLSDAVATHVHSTPCPDVKPETKKRVAFIAVGNPKATASSIGTTLTKKQRLDVIPRATAEPEDLYVKPETKKRVAFIAVGNPKATASSSGTTLTKKQRLEVIPRATAEPEDLYGKFSEDTDKSIF